MANTFYGNATDIALAKKSGVQGNFIDVSSWGQKSIINGIKHNAATGGNPMILGGAGAKGGINDTLLGTIKKSGINIGRIGGKDRYEVQSNLKNFLGQQNTPLQNLVTSAKQNTQTLQNEYKNSQNTKTANGMINATIDDIQKKYGFDFSREYAARQAEAEAQAKRNAYNGSIRENKSANELITDQIEANLREGNTALDHSSFQDFMAARQNQADRGLNAGIAAEQDLRLGMNQQGQMANLYRDASTARNQENNRFSNESLRLQEALKLVEQQKLAQEESLFQDLRGKAFDAISRERSQGLDIDANEWRKIQDRIANSNDLTRIDADRIARETEYSGTYGGQKTAAQIMADFNRRMQESELQLSKDRFAWDKQMEQARLDLARQQAARASSGGGGGSRSTGSTVGSTSMSASQIVEAAKAKAIREQQGQMSTTSPKLDPNAKTGLASQPGSYWYARGYGSQYTPSNYTPSSTKTKYNNAYFGYK